MEPETPGGSAVLSPMELWGGCGLDVSANAMEVTSRGCVHGDSVFAIMKCTETEKGTLEFQVLGSSPSPCVQNSVCICCGWVWLGVKHRCKFHLGRMLRVGDSAGNVDRQPDGLYHH